MNDHLFKKINHIRRQLKILELDLFMEGEKLGINSEVMEDIEGAMECLVNAENKILNALTFVNPALQGELAARAEYELELILNNKPYTSKEPCCLCNGGGCQKCENFF